jgi:NAD-dependent SIR2 family protein deacetylase
VDLARAYDVRIVTQNVDDLHERAGSTRVLHLHGEIMLARSTRDPKLVRHLGERDIELGDLCERGSQLRPHIVWFGEMVPAMDEAVELFFEALKKARRIVVNPDVLDQASGPGFEVVAKPATVGIPEVVAGLLRAAGA